MVGYMKIKNLTLIKNTVGIWWLIYIILLVSGAIQPKDGGKLV